MVATVITEPQTFSAEQQMQNAQLVREFLETVHDNDNFDWYDRYFTSDARILLEGRDDYPVPEVEGSGLELLKKNAKIVADLGYVYEVEIHTIFTCGPLVIASRTDTRKVEGQPDKPVPGVGVYAVKNGKIFGWSDYYR